jgi:peptide deformylase
VAVRPVVRYPDPVLKRPAAPVGEVADDLWSLADDLVETMRAGPATVGLAAPQIAVPLRAFCLDVGGHRRAASSHGLVVLFDPEVLLAEGQDVLREGCLSVPDLTANVRRATRVVVRGMDADGGERVYEMEGFEARALQHELDHLDGMLILDRVGSASDVFPRKTYR